MPTSLSSLRLALDLRRSIVGGVLLALAVASYFGHSTVLRAQDPALPVPSSRWGDLEPRDILLDGTWFSFVKTPGCGKTISEPEAPRWVRAVDFAAGRLFAATGNHIAAWNLSNPASPTELFDVCRPARLTFATSDIDWYYEQLVAASDGEALATAIAGAQGLVVIDVDSPANPTYQDGGYNVRGLTLFVDAAGDEHLALEVLGTPGMAIYDLEKARTANCHENNFASGPDTCSASKTPLVAFHSTLRANGTMAGAGTYLVISYTTSLQVWDLANPAAPVQVGHRSSTSRARAIDAWMSDGQLHVAFGNDQSVDILRYPAGLSCGGALCAGELAATVSTPGVPLGAITSWVDTARHSADQGLHYLYVGSGGIAGSGPQREYLFNITDLTSPRDLTPSSTTDPPLHEEESGVGGYWGWYYHDNGGWDHIDPTDGVVADGHLYRGITGLLDVHAIVDGLPPVADFTRSPAGDVYPGELVEFFDTSTRNPDSWDWSFGDGDSSILQDPTHVYAGPPRTVTVMLEACNDGLCDTYSDDITLLDPTPTVAGVSANPGAATPCASVEFQAVSPTGRPDLVFAWEVRDDNVQIHSESGPDDSIVFALPGTVTGPITAHLTLTSTTASGEASATSPNVAITALPPLGQNPVVSWDTPIEGGLVQFHVTGDAGATSWTWNWGDGSPLETFGLAEEGRNPTHQFPTDGTYDVSVEISNCAEANPAASSPVSVVVPNFEPLVISSFDVIGLSCVILNSCDALTGTEVPFELAVAGEPDLYDFDWDGDGTYEDSDNPAPPACSVSSPADLCHVFDSSLVSSTRTPTVRIRRGSEELTASLEHSLHFSGSNSKTVIVSGPTTVNATEGATYTAGANCAPSGWTWNASGGGAISGTGSSVSITWPSAGSRIVTAVANGAGCNGAGDNHAVTVAETRTVAVAGSTGLLLGEVGGYLASTTNCTVEPTAWTWAESDGSPIGSATANADISWPSAGTKTVSATAVGGSCDGMTAHFNATVFNASCAEALENTSESGSVVLDTSCLVSVGPNYELLGTANLDVTAAVIVIRPPFSTAPGAAVSLRTAPP